MALPVVYRRKVGRDLAGGYAWYEGQRPGLGEEFLAAVDASLDTLEHFPEIFARVHGEVRRAIVSRFQYAVFYRVESKRVVVLSVLHTARDPKLWPRPRKIAGFSYAMVLAAVVIVGIVVEAARVTTWRIVRADREAELLFRGQAYRNAIASFYQSNGAFPRSLEDLPKDPRSASKRHIRALYPDPMSQGEKREWRLIQAGGGISGVASASTEEPLKQANFPREFEKFTGAKSYSEWVFEYVPPARPPAQPPGTKPPGASPPVLRTF